MPVVLELVSSGPAANAEIKPGDALLEINGASTQGLALSDVVSLLIGPVGSRVELAVSAPPHHVSRAVSIVREPVFLASVESTRINDATLYLRIRTFAPDTPAQAAIALELDGDADRLIVDLRGNSGGQLQPAVRSADLLLPVGAEIGSLDAVQPSKAASYKSESEPTAEFAEILVLANRHTSAGAELFALALRAAGRAQVVGERTFGFGTVDTRWPDSNRRVVDGVLLGPNRAVFHEVGVEPDVVPPIDPSFVYPPLDDPLVQWLIRQPLQSVRVAAQQGVADGPATARANWPWLPSGGILQ